MTAPKGENEREPVHVLIKKPSFCSAAHKRPICVGRKMHIGYVSQGRINLRVSSPSLTRKILTGALDLYTSMLCLLWVSGHMRFPLRIAAILMRQPTLGWRSTPTCSCGEISFVICNFHRDLTGASEWRPQKKICAWVSGKRERTQHFLSPLSRGTAYIMFCSTCTCLKVTACSKIAINPLF